MPVLPTRNAFVVLPLPQKDKDRQLQKQKSDNRACQGIRRNDRTIYCECYDPEICFLVDEESKCQFLPPLEQEPSEVGLTGLIWLFLGYGYALYYAANMIGEGSELLLLVPSMAGLVGGVVLPLLGAVPDGGTCASIEVFLCFVLCTPTSHVLHQPSFCSVV